MPRRYSVQYKEVDGQKFYYVDFGSETHGRISFRLWVSAKLVKKVQEVDFDDNIVEYEAIEFPCQATIVQTEKGTLILKPSSTTFVYDVYVPCGYRGSSSIEVLDDHIMRVNYYEYESPRGNLGISEGCLVVADTDKLKIKWSRTGRTYGQPKDGIKIYYADGRTEELEYIEDFEELKNIND